MDDDSHLPINLFCDEELLPSPLPPCFHPSHGRNCLGEDTVPFYATREERDRALACCLEKEASSLLDKRYEEFLQFAGILGCRLRAIRWIIKTRSRMNLSHGSAFDAVNYLDRFIWLNRGKKWKDWMFEALSIACLSIAVKFNDVSIPPLLEFQMEDLLHYFQPEKLQQTELTVMKVLDWRLSSVTAYSYVDLLTWHQDSLHVAITARMTELLLGALPDTKFIEFRPCVIALSALRCSLEELSPSRATSQLSELTYLFPYSHQEEVNKCHKVMEERVVDPLLITIPALGPSSYSPSSPVTVMPVKEIDIIHRREDRSLLKDSSAAKKRKAEQIAHLHQ
ncbi:putative cyclin-D7-1 [Aristolochia californica]|uniref:putative cyclin-D7-1 n=1 Tax=Aristolochia californica TaxID=171875 RepID=UPI0035E3751A